MAVTFRRDRNKWRAWPLLAQLKAFVGDELLRSDYQTVSAMRAEIERLQASIAKINDDCLHAEQERDRLKRGEFICAKCYLRCSTGGKEDEGF